MVLLGYVKNNGKEWEGSLPQLVDHTMNEHLSHKIPHISTNRSKAITPCKDHIVHIYI